MIRDPHERYRPIAGMAKQYARRIPDGDEWWIVRALIPDSWFTKSGPGILDEAQKVWNAFTDKQKAVAVTCGFFAEGGPTS